MFGGFNNKQYLRSEIENTAKENIMDNNILLYRLPNGDVKVEILFKDETLWLTSNKMATLFDVTPQSITRHLKNIYAEGELKKEATCSKMEQVQKEGDRIHRNRSEFEKSCVPARAL